MAERLTLARPYAEAVFKLAKEDNRLADWSAMLALMVAILDDAQMARIADDPNVDGARLLALIKDIAGDRLDDEAGNFVHLLIDNGRLSLMGEIAAQFEGLRAEAESMIEVEVISAYALDDDQKNQIIRAMSTRLGRSVNLNVSEDKSLMGGMVIRAGDLVIDGSVTGRLAALATALTH